MIFLLLYSAVVKIFYIKTYYTNITLRFYFYGCLKFITLNSKKVILLKKKKKIL